MKRKVIKMSEKDDNMMKDIYMSDSMEAHKMGMLEGLLSAFAWMGYEIDHDIADNSKKIKKFN